MKHQPLENTNSRSAQSRINGAKSHGPVSPAGKARSAQNATTHGLTSRRVVLDNENVAIYNSILDRYTNLFAPQDVVEHDLVETMVSARWRIRRSQAMASATLNLAVLESEAEINENVKNADPALAQAYALRAMGRQSSQVTTLQLHEDRFQRMYDRAYKLLSRHRGNKLTALPSRDALINLETDLPDNFTFEKHNEPSAPAEFNFETKLTPSLGSSTGFGNLIQVLALHPELRTQLIEAIEDFENALNA
jgi:hypothetical protein